jgi:mannose-6-phosphate isomerase-like protein (cupin superfamily)
MEPVDIDAAFSAVEEPWTPHLAAELNGQAVKLARADGEFVWHSHDDADELFLVVDGRLRVELRDDDDVVLEDGEFVVVPAGVEHRPVAAEPTEMLLFEPSGTTNTGDVEDELTSEVAHLEGEGHG